MYKTRIKTLTETHRLINKQIDEMEKTGDFKDEQMIDLKKRRLQYKDEIARLTKLQWEYEHETIHGDDER